jgi:hypothetical protein
MHRLLAAWPLVDHEDGNGLNNQRANLRPATQSQNLANQRKRPGLTSQFKGVRWYGKLTPWRASISIGGRRVHLGSFITEEAAARAYDAAALAEWGEYARLNFPVIRPESGL